MDRRIALGAVLVAVLGLGGTWLAVRLLEGRDARFADCRGGVVAGGSIGGPFTLVDETGREVTSEEVIDEPTLLYFGYTFCPDVCPIDSMRNAQAVDLLEEDGIAAQPVFVSVDPARDTPEVLTAYTDNFRDNMLGLTGSDDQVREAAQAYRVLYSANDDDPEFYTVSHTAFSYIVLPEIGFVDIVRRDDSPEAVADLMACYVRAAN